MNSSSKHTARDYAALDDAQLVACVCGGEREAFREITQRCNQRLYRVVRGVIRDEAEAEDVMQEAYLLAYRKIDGFRGQASLATWITRIALNVAYGRLRRRHETVDIDDVEPMAGMDNVMPFPGAMTSNEDPFRMAENAQLRRWLEDAIDALPEGFRLVYLMRDVEGCSVEETASALELREETVKTRLHRARRQLRAALEDRVTAARGGVFEFMGARCARITEAVMARIGVLPGP